MCHVKRLGVVVQLGGHSRLDEHARIVQALISGRIDLVSRDERGRKPGKILYRGAGWGGIDRDISASWFGGALQVNGASCRGS